MNFMAKIRKRTNTNLLKAIRHRNLHRLRQRHLLLMRQRRREQSMLFIDPEPIPPVLGLPLADELPPLTPKETL